MDKLKICFTGVGSIAKRHIRNLRQICIDRNIQLTVDAFRRIDLPVEGVDAVYTNLNDVPLDYDAVFITNPTELHLETLRQFHNVSKNFFIEKPVVSLNQIENAKKFSLKENNIYYVACPLRYNPVIEYIKTNIDLRQVFSIRSISSSYLPEWRPDQDYRKNYSAHKEMGGGVSIDLIHEWDYITYLFGWPRKVYSLIGKKSNLEIDSDDYAIYIADYKSRVVELHLDYFGRETIRQIELFTEDDTIIGDISKRRVKYMKTSRIIDFPEKKAESQKRELLHFLDLIQKNEVPANDDFGHGIKVLELTQGRVVK